MSLGRRRFPKTWLSSAFHSPSAHMIATIRPRSGEDLCCELGAGLGGCAAAAEPGHRVAVAALCPWTMSWRQQWAASARAPRPWTTQAQDSGRGSSCSAAVSNASSVPVQARNSSVLPTRASHNSSSCPDTIRVTAIWTWFTASTQLSEAHLYWSVVRHIRLSFRHFSSLQRVAEWSLHPDLM